MSTRIKAGETTILRVPTNINMSAVETVIFTLIGKRKFTKTYPTDVSYANGEFLIPLTQQNTIDLSGTYSIEGQFNYGNKSVLITDVIKGCIEPSSAVKIISGNTPSMDITTPTLTIGGTVIIVSNGGGSSYTLPKASVTTLGGVKIGNNLSIDNNGVLSATDTTYSDATTSVSGLMSASDKTKLDELSEGGSGDYTLPVASASVLGGIKVGSNLSISNGVLSATNTTYSTATTSANGLMSSSDKTKLNGIATNANNYSLPTASTSVLGGVKVDGSTITILNGVISATSSGSGVSGAVITPTGGAVTLSLVANMQYFVDGAISSLILTAPTSYNPWDEFYIMFTTSSTGCTVTPPAGWTYVDGSTSSFDANKRYEFDVKNGKIACPPGTAVGV